MTTVDEPNVDVALESILKHRKPDVPDTGPRLTGVDWLRARLDRDGYRYCVHPDCGGHWHAECTECGAVKCLGEHGYDRYEETELVCDCQPSIGTDTTTHLVVPFDTFGQHHGFPNQ